MVPQKFIQARVYRKTPAGRAIQAIVIHSAETPERAGTALALAKWASSASCKASWHYAVDAAEVVQSVLEQDVAWHCKSFSTKSVGIELCGRASQTREQWLDAESMLILQRAAFLVRDIAERNGMPLQFVDAAGLLRGDRGITTHFEVSCAFKDTDHIDPGKNFPMDELLRLANDEDEAPITLRGL